MLVLQLDRQQGKATEDDEDQRFHQITIALSVDEGPIAEWVIRKVIALGLRLFALVEVARKPTAGGEKP